MVIGVYGLGRFGAFWAETLSQRFVVKGYSRNPDRTVGGRVQKVDEDEVLLCDALFLCVSISAMEEVCRRIASRIPRDTVVFDTCSVKVHPIRTMREVFQERTRLIGTHPMFGPDSGKDGIGNLPLVICPVRCTAAVVDRWKLIFESFGLRIFELDPEEHDRAAAYTQGITHFMGRVLQNLRLEPSEIGTVGYQKLLEIVEQTCNDPLQLFYDLQQYNPFTSEMRKKLAEAVHEVDRSLEEHEEHIDSD